MPTCAARTKWVCSKKMLRPYPIDPELRRLRHVRAPMNRVFLLFSRVLLKSLPRNYDRKDLDVRKFKADGGNYHLLLPKNRTQGEPLPCLFYMHGGGFVFPSSPFQRKLVSEYAAKAGIAVIDIEYPLCPKHTHPDAALYCATVIGQVLWNAPSYGIDPNRVALGGDSAGALLALESQLALQKSKCPKPRCLFLVYPVTDDRMDPSLFEYLDLPGWDAGRNAIMWRYFLKGKPYESPLRRADFIDVDRLYVEICPFDCLRDQGKLLYDALRGRVGEAVLREPKGTFHGYDVNRKAAVTEASMEARISFLRGLHGR